MAPVLLLLLASSHPQEVSFEDQLLARIPESESINYNSFTFSRTGTSVAFIGNRGGKYDKTCGTLYGGEWRVWLGDRPSQAFEDVGGPLFSPDGRSLSYMAQMEGKWYVWAPNAKLGPFETSGFLNLSPDGETLAYVKWVSEKEIRRGTVHIGDRSYGPFERVGDVVFSPDGTRHAYAFKQEGRWAIAVGDMIKGDIQGLTQGPLFSPDGKVAYVVTDRARHRLVVGDKVGPSWERIISRPVFSGDGSVAAYAVFDGETERVIVGNTKGPGFSGVSQPTLNHDGTQVAYAVHEGGKLPGDGASLGGEEYVVINGERAGPSYESILTPLVFSPKETRLAYRAKTPRGWVIVAGDTVSEPFDEIWWRLSFSADGSKVTFGARKGRELWWKVLEVQ